MLVLLAVYVYYIKITNFFLWNYSTQTRIAIFLIIKNSYFFQAVSTQPASPYKEMFETATSLSQ